jgi:transposase
MSHDQKSSITENASTFNGKILTAFQRKLLRKSMHEDLPQLYRKRIEIMLLADEGKSQTEISQNLGCCPATVRHWMHIARTGMAHQWQDCPIGSPRTVSQEYLERLKELVSHSPRDYGYPFMRWTGNWLSKHLSKEFGIDLSDRHINRLLKQMGLSCKPKPNHTDNNTSEKVKNSKILIGDIKSEKMLISPDLLPINLTKLSTDLDIHGGKYIRTVNIFAAAKPNFRLFSFH